MDTLKPVCIIMASGASSRFGGDKLSALLEGKTLLRRALESVPPELFSKVLLVTDRPAGALLAREFRFLLIPNDSPEEGVSRTIRLGLEAAGACSGALFLVADQPLLQQETVAQLVQVFCSNTSQIVCAAHNGVRGNPCLFPACFFPELQALSGDAGGSAVIRRHPEAVRLVEVPAAQLADVDTPAQLDALHQRN